MSPSIMELKLKRCGVACGGLFLPKLLFEDDTSLFGEDVQGLEHSLRVLQEWCLRCGMKVNVEKSAIIHFRRNHVCPVRVRVRGYWWSGNHCLIQRMAYAALMTPRRVQ